MGGNSSCGDACHLNKPTSQSPCSNLQSPSTNLEIKESRSTGASKDKSSILCLTCAMRCYKLLFVNDSCICLSHSAQQSTVGPDSFPWLPDGTWVDGCIFRLDTSQHRSFFYPSSHVRNLEICSCHFLLLLFTVFGCHNISPGQWLDVHSFNLLLRVEKK